jgi:hypothetical protein
MKFNAEEKELIAEMLVSGEWNVAMKGVAIIVERLKVELLTTHVDDSGRQIVLRKKRLEGAQAVEKFMNNIRNEIKREGLDG